MAVTTEVAFDLGKEYELVNGKPEEKEMAGARHGGVGSRLHRRLGNFVEENGLGEVYGPDTTFLIGENQRMPDTAFVPAEKIPPEGEPEGIWEIAPDLAVEVISPNDLFEKVQDKLWDYFNAGVKQVWLAAPQHRTISVYRSPFDITMFGEDQELISEDLLPGFRCKLREIFKTPARP